MLTGQPPAALEIGVSTINGPPPPIPLALPSQLLERRPDIAANERLVAAANANVGIAETAYYPTLTLSASAGFLSTNLANLLTWAAAPGPPVRPFSDAVRFRPPRRPGRGRSKPLTMPLLPLTARPFSRLFRKSRMILPLCAIWPKKPRSNRKRLSPPSSRSDLEIDRYKAGTDSYLNVITTQTIALSDQQTAITILQRRMTAAVDL